MLVISRKEGERIKLGDDIWIELVEADNGKAKISIVAPKDISIIREELLDSNREFKREVS